MSRERFKSCWRDLVPALTAAAALAREAAQRESFQPDVLPSFGQGGTWERMVSERLLQDSKLLGRVRQHVVNLFIRADPRWEGIAIDEAGDVLETYGVRRKPGLIRCAGAATLRLGERSYRLEDFEPVAHLPESWSDAWVASLVTARIRQLTTIENEFPFLSYVEESAGPAGLGARAEVAVYTAGFLSTTLANTLGTLAQQAGPDLKFRHWGDADVGGIRIWWQLRTRLERPVALFRSTADWAAAECPRGGRPLARDEARALARLRSEIESTAWPDGTEVIRLIDVLLNHGVKLEQERF